MAFFTKYLCEDVANPELRTVSLNNGASPKRPLKMPQTYTISEFFAKAHGLETEDRVSLLLELYDCYKSLNPQAESLDEFIAWGEMILSDFSDVDKYLADPAQVFRNVAEYREMQDDMSYLSESQREAINNFIGHFRDANGLKDNVKGDNVKSRFLKIWDLLLPLYQKFNHSLESRNLAYDGMVYRRLVEKLSDIPAADLFHDVFPKCVGFVFVGLNALNECEKTVLRKMHSAGIAEFCWDYSSSMLKNLRNKASEYMKENVRDFPQLWPLEPCPDLPQINVLNVPSAVGQAKQLPEIFSRLGISGSLECTDCAIVLPDESMLTPVLNSIPPKIQDINVTMGYPMSDSNFWSLMSDVASLQLHLRKRKLPQGGEEWLFYHKQAGSILSSGIITAIMDDVGRGICARIKSEAKYYIPQSDFKGNLLLELLFQPAIQDASLSDSGQISRFQQYQMCLVSALAQKLLENPAMAIELEFARRYYACVNILKSKTLSVLPVTYVRLLSQIARLQRVPFSGEPLKGLQIMGPLETRALDFKNVIILSCNEGIFPKKNVSTSFIPPELRRGFGLPTNEFKDAVLAYSFYRLIQRAENLWLLSDSRMEKMKSGEESRYIKQLEYHFRVPLKRYISKSEMSTVSESGAIPKPADMAQILKQKHLSASSIENYLCCPARFYYATVCGLKVDSKVAEAMDAGMVGNVYHAVMQALYLGETAMSENFPMDRKSVSTAIESGRLTPLEYVSDEYLAGWLERKKELKAKINSLVKAELNTMEVRGRDLVMSDVIFNYAMKTLQRDRELLREKAKNSFKVLGLELKLRWSWEGFNFLGYIDRVDSFDDGSVRIVDYKTGKVNARDLNVNDANAEILAEKIFSSQSGVSMIPLQLFFYDKFMESSPLLEGKNLVNVIYSPAALFKSPVSEFESPRSEIFCSECTRRLKDLLSNLIDPSLPFERTENKGDCAKCDFKNICGRQ